VGVFAVAAVAVSGAVAQELLNMEDAARQMRRNQEELRQYSWKSTYTYIVNGAQRRVDGYRMRYDSDGFLEKIQEQSDIAKGKLRGADGKKLNKKEREAAFDFVMEVKSQIDGYFNPMFAEKAVARSVVTSEGEVLRLDSQHVITAGDSVNLEIERSTKRPLTAHIKTVVDGSPVDFQATFGSMEYGPNYVASSVTTTEWKGLKLVINTENSDYTKNLD
jgi:hypothetical protein